MALSKATLLSLKEIAESLHHLAVDDEPSVSQKLYIKINGEEYKYLQSEGAAEAIAAEIDAVARELHRLTHGPFTLAEAVASGRPFRRKAWGESGKWMYTIYVDGNGNASEFINNNDECRAFSYSDFIECDYELMPEGGE